MADLVIDEIFKLPPPFRRVIPFQNLAVCLYIILPCLGFFNRKPRSAVRLGGGFVCLQVFCLLRRRLQRLRQLSFRRLGLFLLRPGQLVNEGADGVPDLLKQRPVLPVPLNEFVQHLSFVNEPPRVVRRRLVHGLLPAQRLSLPIVGVDPILNPVLLLSRHKIPEGPVLVGGQLLHPVGEFVADQEHYRVFVVFLNQNLAALDLRVCLPAVHAVREARPQPQSLSHAVYLVRRLGGQIGPCLAIGVLDGPPLLVLHQPAALHRLPASLRKSPSPMSSSRRRLIAKGPALCYNAGKQRRCPSETIDPHPFSFRCSFGLRRL